MHIYLRDIHYIDIDIYFILHTLSYIYVYILYYIYVYVLYYIYMYVDK